MKQELEILFRGAGNAGRGCVAHGGSLAEGGDVGQVALSYLIVTPAKAGVTIICGP
jgi:hypothetical protein